MVSVSPSYSSHRESEKQRPLLLLLLTLLQMPNFFSLILLNLKVIEYRQFLFHFNFLPSAELPESRLR